LSYCTVREKGRKKEEAKRAIARFVFLHKCSFDIMYEKRKVLLKTCLHKCAYNIVYEQRS